MNPTPRMAAWTLLALPILVGHLRAEPTRADKLATTEANNAFAFDLFGHLQKEAAGNLFLSPYSVSSALAMTLTGARGNTESQMAKALHFELPKARLHPACGALADEIQGAGKGKANERPYELIVANAMWAQKRYPFREDYVSLVRTHYAAGLTSLDFARDPKAARQRINDWVGEKTQGKIRNLLGPGDVVPATRLVLTNAIYFKGVWASPFPKYLTRDAPFYVSRGKHIQVPTMRDTVRLPYVNGKGFKAAELPYRSNRLSMVIFLPKEVEGLAALEGALTPSSMEQHLKAMRKTSVGITLPKFRIDTRFDLVKSLHTLGMRDAFASGVADFTGMTEKRELFIGFVIHRAVVEVDEKGTEAAAATAVGPPAEGLGVREGFVVDRPFFFLIRDNATGTILFMGRVTDPSSSQ